MVPLYFTDAIFETSRPASLDIKWVLSIKLEATVIAKSLISTWFEFIIFFVPLTVKSPDKIKFLAVNDPLTSKVFNEALKVLFCKLVVKA